MWPRKEGNPTLKRYLIASAASLLLSPLLLAQKTNMQPAAEARLEQPAFLPDAPSAIRDSLKDQAQDKNANSPIRANVGNYGRPVAKKYASVIYPGQQALPLSATDKMVYAVPDAFGLMNLASVMASAGWSHLVDSAPHYGHNSEAFGKRVGAASLRNVTQSLSTDAVFAPIFHDDPRYYQMGRDQNFFKRGLYAASRVVVTRSDSGHQRLNAPLLLGYGTAAGVSNFIYPDQDTGAKATLGNYGMSLGGAAIGMLTNEFLDDALRIVHLRK